MPAVRLDERARPLNEAAVRDDGTVRVRIITPGWGSSGHYSQEVLEAAAADRVFPAGLHMFLDHPTVTEETDRPERSVRDLVGSLATDAVWDGDGLYADARVIRPFREALDDLADIIGVSIRGVGEGELGEAEGRQGRIITRLVEADSVDFVTRAGRGGQVMQLLESALRPAVEAHGMTANDLRDVLNGELQQAHAGDGRWVWVRDYADDWVVYELEGDHPTPGLFRVAYTVADGQVSLDANPVEVRVRTEFVPVNDPEPAPQVPAEEAAMPENPTAEQLAEATRARDALQEQLTTVTRERDDAVARADRAEEALRHRDARDAAVEALADTGLRDSARQRVVERVLREDIPLTDAGQVNRDQVAERARTLAKEEAAYLAEATGTGRPRGVGGASGGGVAGDSAPQTVEDYHALGVSESLARIAASR